MIQVDTTGRIIVANEAFFQWFGACPREGGPDSWLSLAASHDQSRLKAAAQLLGTQVKTELDLVCQTGSGDLFPVRMTLTRITTLDHQPAGLVASLLIGSMPRQEVSQASGLVQWPSALAESVPVMVWCLDLQGNLVYVNKAFLAFAGLQDLQDVQSVCMALMHPEDQAGFMETVQGSLAQQQCFSLNLRMKHHSGEYRWINAKGAPMTQPDGRLFGYCGICTDFTEQKQIEDALREREAALTRAQSVAQIGSFEWNIRTNQLLWSKQLNELFEVASRKVPRTYEEVLAFIHPEDRERFSQAVSRAASGDMYQMDYRITTARGEDRILHEETDCLLDETGQVVKLFGTCKDVTELRKMERLRLESEARFQRAFESASVGMTMRDLQGHYLQVNQAFCDMLGYSRAELLALGYQAVTHPEDLAAEQRMLDRILARLQDSGEIEVRYCHRDGRMIWTLLSISLVCDEQNQPSYFIKLSQNITHRKEAEYQLLKAKEESEMANRAKSDFLARMSHEIRTPMNGVLGLTEILLNSPLTAEQQRYVQLTQKSATHLLRIINDILDFSKIEAGKLDLNPGHFRLRQTISEMLQPQRILADEKGLYFHCHVEEGIPNDLIGDPVRLVQVVSNLVSNAIKFTPSGEVCMFVQLVAQSEHDVQVAFSVRDTGIGISKEKLKDIFEPFIQADVSTTRNYGGTGLGLSIAVQLVNLMKGAIHAERQASGGMHFRVTLPFLRACPQVDKAETVLRQNIPNAPMFKGRTALVVDHNPHTQWVLRERLQFLGVNPIMLSSCREAIALLVHGMQCGQRYDLLILDADEGNQELFATLADLRKKQAVQSIPIVLMGVNLLYQDSKSVYQTLEASGYLFKPFSSADLRELLRAVLHNPASDSKDAPSCQVLPDGPAVSLNILLAEDNPINQEVATMFLRELGHQVKTVSSGTQVLEALQSETFDLVLMDVFMPDMDGWQATEAVRKQEVLSGRHLPIIAVTANAMKEDQEVCLARGMDAYLSKPFTKRELETTLAKLCGQFNLPNARGDQPKPTAHRQLWETICAYVAGNERLALMVVERCLEQLPQLLTTLETAWRQQEWGRLRDSLHQTRGTLGYVIQQEPLYQQLYDLELQAALAGGDETNPVMSVEKTLLKPAEWERLTREIRHEVGILLAHLDAIHRVQTHAMVKEGSA
jgi:PAS domain S-box-containing protein